MLAGDLCRRAHVEGEDQMEPAHSISCYVAWGVLPTLLAAMYFIVWGRKGMHMALGPQCSGDPGFLLCSETWSTMLWEVCLPP